MMVEDWYVSIYGCWNYEYELWRAINKDVTRLSFWTLR